MKTIAMITLVAAAAAAAAAATVYMMTSSKTYDFESQFGPSMTEYRKFYNSEIE